MRPVASVIVALLLAAGVWAGPVAPVEGPHDGLSCDQCHRTTPPPADGVTCGGEACHPAAAGAFATSRHDRRELRDHRPRCPQCHGGHRLLTGTRALVAACGGAAEATCWSCHPRERYGLPRFGLGADRGGDVHEQAKMRLGCASATISCFTCHGHHGVEPLEAPGSPVSRSRVAETCGSCHTSALDEYRGSIHARGLEEGLAVAPTCTSCHGAHGVQRVDGKGSPTAASRVVYTCADCHEDPGVVEAAQLPAGVVDSYEQSLHGIAYRHGMDDVATCVSCHGAHGVRPSGDPASPVSPSRIRSTCLRCHAEVTADIIESVRHPKGRPGPRGLLERLRVYFPVAATAVNPLVISGLGAVVGFLSGVFGVGGGFLMTPLLIFIGIPAAVAAATDAAQITAGASSGAISHARLGNVDFKMGLAMVAGSWPGGFLGVQIVHALRSMGNFDFFLKLVYVLLLAFTGFSMLVEGVRTLTGRTASAEPGPGRLGRALAALPGRMSFPRSGLEISVLMPVMAGFAVGILAAFLGVGGGFILMPVMIYIIGIPTRVAVGTGLFQIVLTCAYVTLQQSITNHTVDVLLAVALFAGSTVGAQFGVLASRRLKGEQIRVLLGVIVIVVMGLLLGQLVSKPDLLIQFAKSGGGH